MPIEDVMTTVMRWATATEALAALGAQLALDGAGEAPADVVRALRAVSAAGGLGEVDELPPPQRAMLAGLVRMYLHQAVELVDDPTRPPGWTSTNPAILDGFGRGSAMVPAMIAAAHPDLARVGRFLDVGTGVGLLAVAAAGVWPEAVVVGIDRFGPALDRGRAHVTAAGLGDRITLRRQDVTDLDETDTYDCVWLPSFFLAEVDLDKALPAAVRALRPGGWIVLGRTRSVPDPLATATAALRWLRAGGCALDADRARELLDAAGCADVHVAQLPGPAPIELVLGQRPATTG